jgi:predicted negative regulator of RcsB-dependent stress response
MQRYFDLVNQYSKMASDPQSAGVAAVVAASDILKPRGAEAAITWFNKVLPETKNPAVQRAIRTQLADLYKQSGQADKALEQLQALMTEAGAGPTSPPAR